MRTGEVFVSVCLSIRLRQLEVAIRDTLLQHDSLSCIDERTFGIQFIRNSAIC